MKRILKASLVVVSLFLLISCGGGGGSGSDEGPDALTLASPQDVQVYPGSQSATLLWSPVAGAGTYNIYLATQSGVTKTNFASLSGGARLTGRSSPSLVSSLTNGQTYYFVVTALNALGDEESSESLEVSSTPTAPALPGDPSPVTVAATQVTHSGAVLNGSFTNPAGYTTTVWFEYGETAAYGNSSSSQAFLAAGANSFSESVNSLPERTAIHFRFVAQNAGGTFYGQDETFTTYTAPEVLLSDLDGPQGFAFDGSHLYWMELYSGRVRRYDVSGGSAETLATASFLGNTGALALDATHVYFTDTGALRRMDLDGGNLSNNFSTAASPYQILPGVAGIYVRDSQEFLVDGNFKTHYFISRISSEGSTRTELYQRTPVDGTGFGGGTVTDGSYLYFSDYYFGKVMKLPVAGGTPVTLSASLLHPNDLVLDGSYLYVSHDAGISRINVNTGVAVAIFTGTAAFAEILMVKDGDYIYASNDAITRIDATTGEETILVNGTGWTSAPIVTSTHVYWIAGGNHFYPPLGRLCRVAKP